MQEHESLLNPSPGPCSKFLNADRSEPRLYLSPRPNTHWTHIFCHNPQVVKGIAPSHAFSVFFDALSVYFLGLQLNKFVLRTASAACIPHGSPSLGPREHADGSRRGGVGRSAGSGAALVARLRNELLDRTGLSAPESVQVGHPMGRT